MEVLNALQLKQGKKAQYNRMGTITQPIQFLPRDEKDTDWSAWCLDWHEWRGLMQIRRNAQRLMKNYKLAKGIIDRSDYIVENNNEYRELVDILAKEDMSALDLKFYPIIPNVINTLCSEFAKRNTKITFRSVDEFSYNELLEQKRSQIEQVLFADAEKKLMDNMIQQGLDPEDPEVQKQIEQQTSPESMKTLPEIEGFFKKDYRSMVEQWAEHQYKVDVERFNIDELEERAFRNMLITDREFWHFKMMEDDYDIELWNPVLTFYNKSPETRYISQGNWVGKVDMMNVADVVDKYGYLMTQDQLEALEAIYPVRSAGYPLQGYQNDGSYYDATKSHDWNVNQPGLAYRQFVSMSDNFGANGGDIVTWIMGQNEDYVDAGMSFLLRCTTVYWKSQRKVGHLTKIKENGEVITDIIDEDYKVTDKPMYNTTLMKNKSKDNLVFGENIDWIWINEVWGGVKIGPNHPSFWGQKNPGGVNPMYIGIDKNRVAPLRYQFKGDKTLYGCKLPVEGAVFSDYNTRSVTLVDLMKPFQVGYNIVNNQIADILVDELGTVVMFDQNALPRHSMGEDWGKNNLAKAYVAMKNFQMLPLDTTLANAEHPIANQAFQQLDLEQSKRLLSRVNLANYFKQEAFSVIGVTPQRMGQEISRQTATGVEQSVNSSYAQTETYFIQHSDYLMPRVHAMRTDLAQFYNSTKPSARLQYITSKDEKVNFEINGSELLLRDLNVYCTSKAVDRALLEELRQLAVGNNTGGATIYDLGNLMQADSIAEITHTLKSIEEKASAANQEKMQHEEKLKQMEIDAKAQERKFLLDHEAMEAEKNRRKDIFVAEIRAAGYAAGVDKNNNGQNDYQDFLDKMNASEEFQQSMTFENEKEQNKQTLNNDKQKVQREKMQNQVKIKEIDLQIAKENKNKFDKSKKETPKKK